MDNNLLGGYFFMEKFKELIYFIKEKRGIIIVSIIIFLGFFISCFGVYKLYFNKTNRPLAVEVKEEKTVEIVDSQEEKVEEEAIAYSVEIKGEVVKPGVYTLESGKRVIDVVNMAKGFTKNADSSVINLSKKIQDEMVIMVYSKKQVENFVKTKEAEQKKQELCKQDYVVENDACIDSGNVVSNNSNRNNNNNNNFGSSDSVTNKISINTATLEELMSLSGIGQAKAQSIIDYRTNEGKFNTIEDIMNVSGIGEALFEKIKNSITV